MNVHISFCFWPGESNRFVWIGTIKDKDSTAFGIFEWYFMTIPEFICDRMLQTQHKTVIHLQKVPWKLKHAYWSDIIQSELLAQIYCLILVPYYTISMIFYEQWNRDHVMNFGMGSIPVYKGRNKHWWTSCCIFAWPMVHPKCILVYIKVGRHIRNKTISISFQCYCHLFHLKYILVCIKVGRQWLNQKFQAITNNRERNNYNLSGSALSTKGAQT